MAQQSDTALDDYEYEYDATETETFFVNIDLTSYNGPFRPLRAPSSTSSAPRATTTTTTLNKADGAAGTGEVVSTTLGKRKREGADEAADEEEAASAAAVDESDDRVQIMELHSRNPYVSYRNRIFSCEWADMVGTEMHFVRRADLVSSSELDPTFLKHTEDYSLIASNPIKIIGQRAHFARPSVAQTAASVAAAASTTTNDETETSAAAAAADTADTHANPSTQIGFLQELMDIKRAKREMDMVKMVFGSRRNQRFEYRISKWACTEERIDTIHRLNRAVLGGDQEALVKLEELYDEIERSAG